VPIIGADLGSDANLTITLTQGSRTIQLGTATTGPDGHFTADLLLPADFPNGYSELVADGDDGSRTSIWILVGPRSQSTPTAPPGQTQWWQDPALWLISGLLAGGGIALAIVALRSRRTPPVRMAPVRTRTARKKRGR